MTNNLVLNASNREGFGSKNSRKLRREGFMPATVYGSGKSLFLVFNHNDILLAMKKPGFLSSVLELLVDGKSIKVMLKEYQSHVVKKQILHMDFLYVKDKEIMTIEVPLVFVGEAENEAVKAGAAFNAAVKNIEVACLPTNLPSSITVDVSKIKLDETLHVSDLIMPTGVSLASQVDGSHDLPIIAVHMPKKISVEEPVEVAQDAEDDKADS